MGHIAKWVQRHWVKVILIPIIGGALYSYLPILMKPESEIEYDITHKIENEIHSFEFMVRNEGSGEFKKNEYAVLQLLFRKGIDSVFWPEVYEYKEEFCSGYKTDEKSSNQKDIFYYYRLKINQLAPGTVLKFTIYSAEFLEKAPNFQHAGNNNITPKICTAANDRHKVSLCSNQNPLSSFEESKLYKCKKGEEERCNCPYRAPL